jgi:ACS family tartrate transporter-like MFS transporter
MLRTLEQQTMRKVYLRLLPFAILMYFLCYLDRINVGFAALTMNKDLGLTATTYGFAAGAFFWGYVLFEVPSNIVLEKVGARLWIARIMVTWGLISGATALATGPWSFAVLRFLLGVAEAGFYPGIILYLTYWFPEQHRARVNGGFTIALPAAVAFGAPVSTTLLVVLDGVGGLAGWKWMYICEAVPTVLIGVAVFFCLTDRPAKAHWLADNERAWLAQTLDAERKRVSAEHQISLWRAFWDPKVLLLALNFFGIVTASLGMLLFLPQIVKQLGLSTLQVGFVSMIPYLCGCVSMLGWAWISDRTGERRWNLFGACLLSVGGLIFAGLTIGSPWALVGMSLAAAGFYGTKGIFWALPPRFLTGSAAAVGIALINSLGNLGGTVGPPVVGWAKDATGSFAAGLYALAAFALLSAVVAALWLDYPRVAMGKESAVPAE